MQSLAELRAGRTSGNLRVSEAGLGALTLPAGGSGGYVSLVLDSQQKVDWRSAVVQASLPGSSKLVLKVRTGSTPDVDGSWTSWRPVGAGGALGGSGRYLQFAVDLTAPAGTSPTVSAVGFTHTGGLPAGDPETGG